MSEAIPCHPSLAEFTALSTQGNVIPVWAELTADYETPLSAFEKLGNASPRFLLESAEITSQAGRYSIMGSQPRAIISAHGRQMTLRTFPQGHGAQAAVKERVWETATNPLKELETFMGQYRYVSSSQLPGFCGGAVGYLGYDMVQFFEPTVTQTPPDVLGIPDMLYLLADTVVIFDHRYRTLKVVANALLEDSVDAASGYAQAAARVQAMVALLQQPQNAVPHPTVTLPPLTQLPPSNTSKEEFCEMVLQGKEFIKAGDIFQFVPSQRFSIPYEGRPTELYRSLRHVNPSPYMFCLELEPGFALVGSSPEVHVRTIAGRVDIRPIAGTRWRGKTPQEDDALAEELLADEKERAEHLMLVDLARNDVGRISEFGSVVVDDLMIIERYSHVMHIVSNVRGKLAADRTAYDVMAATFPAGTVSGSPKVRAMQIINSLEKNKRCAYAGAVGYFGFDGNADSCIALRTCVLKDGQAHVQAGGGVVADSNPIYEYNETVNKAMAIIRAVERAKTLSPEG